MKRGLCTHKNGVTTATKYCPECGRLGLEIHYGGDSGYYIGGGEVICNSHEDYFSCPNCGYVGDGEPELPPIDDDLWDDEGIYEEV